MNRRRGLTDISEGAGITRKLTGALLALPARYLPPAPQAKPFDLAILGASGRVWGYVC